MDLPAEARRRIETEQLAWLTVVTGSGAPAPNPVWFLPDGGDVLVFVQPDSAKARNVAARPRVTLHFETRDPAGEDVTVLHGTAVLQPGVPPMAQPGFARKYAALMDEIGLSAEEMDTYDTLLRITPTRARVGL